MFDQWTHCCYFVMILYGTQVFSVKSRCSGSVHFVASLLLLYKYCFRSVKCLQFHDLIVCVVEGKEALLAWGRGILFPTTHLLKKESTKFWFWNSVYHCVLILVDKHIYFSVSCF